MKQWEKQAVALLDKSLSPVPHELNELDWKSNLSTKTEKLAQHLAAFSNYEGGGFLVYGISDSGIPEGLPNKDYTDIIKKLGNIARNSLEPAVSIHHSIVSFNHVPILFIFVPESHHKPVYSRGKTIYDSYIRSAAQTRKMTKQEISWCIAKSSNINFEEELAINHLSADEVIQKLDFVSYFKLLNQNLPDNKSAILNILAADNLIVINNEDYGITNLGAILFANNLNDFPRLKRKATRVIIYEGTDRLKTIKEQQDIKGYASGFEGLVKYINDQLPTNEVIGQALRCEVKMYPEIAIRELVANSLIHQDFYVTGTSPMVEVFSNRIEITNPGKPLINTLRFIDCPPKSRNEILASVMRRINICEERGSGIDKVITNIELFQLPAPDFIETEDHLKAILYAPKSLSKMDRDDRIRACYQHCCLKYVAGGEKMSNSSLRKRFNISAKNYPMASRIITETLEANLIKSADPDSKSRKYAFYIPFWA
ncbi:MAG: ATP-binding protein [Nitrospirota bacterium]